MLFDIYRKTFEADNDAFWWGGETHYRSWDDGTMYLYLFIVFISFLAAWWCDKRRFVTNASRCGSKYKISRCFLIIHMILLLFMGLRGSWVPLYIHRHLKMQRHYQLYSMMIQLQSHCIKSSCLY